MAKHPTVEIALDDQVREVELKKGMWVLHPEGFEAEITEVYEDSDDVLLEDSDGEYLVDFSEIKIQADDFYKGRLLEENEIHINEAED